MIFISVTDDPDTLSLTTSYQYDGNGNLRHQYDVRGNDVEFTYDALNRKTSHIQHKQTSNLVTTYTSYDEEGNLTGMTDPKGQSFTYTYDELNRRTDENLPAVATPYLTLSKVHTDYDANNNVTGIAETKKATDGSTVTDITTNTYDNFDRLLSTTERGVAISYAYDNNGNRTLVSSPTGSTIYTYDSRNRLETASDGGVLVTSFTYYPDGKKNTITNPNGTDVKYTYFDTNRIKTLVNEKTADGTVISSYAYVYDKNGNRTSQTEIQNGVTETTAYTYDSLDRLATFTITRSGNTTLTEYSFEGYNRKTEKVTTNGAVTVNKTYNYDETNWLATITDSISGGVINYAYDRNGNTMLKTDSLSSDQNRSFAYNSLNGLVQATDANNNVLGLYDYNSSGMRIRHRYSDRGDIDYFYDGRSIIDEYDSSGNFIAHYNYADRLLNLTTLSGIQYYHHDGLGSTVNLTDTTAATQVSYHLDPWGHIRSQYGYSINRHVFTDKEHDLNTGLVYFGARFYDPDTARFITQDTYPGEQNTPPSLHRYLYAYSNPTVFVDLYGYASLNTDELFKDPTIFIDPMRFSLKSSSIVLDYLGQTMDEYANTHTMGDFATGGLTALKTVTTVAKGISDSPETFGKEAIEFAKDPKLENLPMLGSVGKNLGTSAAQFVENPTFETGVQLGGALGSAYLSVEGGRSLGATLAEQPVVASNILGAKIKIEPKITGEITDSIRTAGREMLEKVKTSYRESRLADETGGVRLGKSAQAEGNVYWDSNASRWRDATNGRFTKAPAEVTNPLPENGVFVRIMPKKYAEAFIRGEGSLGVAEEVFIGAADDVAGITTRTGAQ